MTREQARAALIAVADACLDVVKASPHGTPAGHLYAALMPLGISLDQFQAIMGALVKTGKVRLSNNCYHAI